MEHGDKFVTLYNIKFHGNQRRVSQVTTCRSTNG